MGDDSKFGKITTERGNIPEDEPVFVLRAQDALAPYAVQTYADLRRAVGDEDAAQQIEGVVRRMRAWPKKKLPD